MNSPGCGQCYGFSALLGGVLAISGVLLGSCGAPPGGTSMVVGASAAEEVPARGAGARLGRVVAVGDLHADLEASLAVLSLAGLVDEEGHWAGGEAVLVQTGDVTDRGPDSRGVIELLERLEGEAAAAGGRVVAMLGNHEVMNLLGDWRYVHPDDVADFGSVEQRRAAFAPDAPLGARLVSSPMVLTLDRVVYTHGGVSPDYAALGEQALNTLLPRVLSGSLPPAALGEGSPVWYRGYAREPERTACKELEAALLELAAERMIVGHTTRRDGRIQSRCGGRLLVIDTGISAYYGGHLAAVELVEGDARAIYPSGTEDLPDP